MGLTRTEQIGFRKSHAFVIGIDEYPYMKNNLNNAVSDASAIAKLLKGVQGFDNVLLMTNPDKAQIETLLTWLKTTDRSSTFRLEEKLFSEALKPVNKNRVFRNPPYRSKSYWLKLEEELTEAEKDQLQILEKEDADASTFYLKEEIAIDISHSPSIGESDSVVFYYAGHGIPKKSDIINGPEGYIAPTDAIDDRFEDEDLLPMSAIYEAFSTLNCHHTLLILDCCFAGRFRHTKLTRSGDIDDFLGPMYNERFDRFKNGKALQVMVSCGPDQVALDAADWADIRGKSPFAKTLIKALGADGLGDINSSSNRDGVISVAELRVYVWDKVEAISSGELETPQYPDLFPMGGHGTGQFIFFNPKFGINQEEFAINPNKNPYKGLKAYTKVQEDAELFFGREKAIQEVIEKFEQLKTKELPPIIFICAPSGYGKSSLVKAGVLHQLDKAISFSSLRPSELANNLDIAKFEDLGKELAAPTQRLLLVDQYEEFFDLLQKEALQEKLFTLLGTIAPHKHKVIITVRSDYEWQMRKSALAAYWNTAHIYRLAAMDLDELRTALIGPAWYSMRIFQDHTEQQDVDKGEALINEILEEVANAPGALPLLSFTMHEFYELARKENRGFRLILEDYTDLLGGVQGALSRKADKVYNKNLEEPAKNNVEEWETQYMHTLEEQEIMKKLLLRMVNPSGGAYTRRRVFYAEHKEGLENNGLNALDTAHLKELDFPQNSALVKIVIDKLVAAHLIQQGGKEKIPYIEPVHDSLFNHWDTFKGWIEEFGKENLILQRQLWEAVLEREKKNSIT